MRSIRGLQRLLAGALAVVCVTVAAQAYGEVPASACSCAMGTDEENAQRADVVFIGDLTSFRRSTGRSPEKSEYAVTSVLKGSAHEQEQVESPGGSAACSSGLTESGTYLVFANRSEEEPDQLVSRGCEGTRLIGEERVALNAGEGELLPGASAWVEREQQREEDVVRWAAVGMAVVAALGLAGVALVRRRKPQV